MIPLSCRGSFLIVLLGGAAVNSAPANVTLPSLLSDHVVLQLSAATRVWGKADPNEKVKVTLDKASADAVAGADGRWQVNLDLSQAGQGPFDLVIQGNNQLTVHDVLVGQVWVASGQSNMESPIRRTDTTDEEIAKSADSYIRHFKVRNTASKEPKDDVAGSWVAAGPDTTGSFSGVAYFFSKQLRETLNVPVGIINASWGGTPIEPWISREAIDSVPVLKASTEKILKEADDFSSRQVAYAAAVQAWESKYDRADHPSTDAAAFAGVNVSEQGWNAVTLPGKVDVAGTTATGAIWLRRKVEIPAQSNGFRLSIDNPHGFETVFWNGEKIGGMTPATFPGVGAHHTYNISASQAHAGENVIAVRLYDPVGPFGIGAIPMLTIYPALFLPGGWLAKAEYELPAPSADAIREYPKPFPVTAPENDRPSFLYNGMIHPLVPDTIQGVIWYQGESNTGRAFQYRSTFPLLINDWRHQWKSEFPFYFCQVSNDMMKSQVPQESAWAELREAQTMALSLPKTGQAVLIDLGEEGEVHYRDKRDVGKRLALVALAKTYGKPIVSSGPVYDSFRVEGDKVRIRFKEVNGGLVAKPLPATYRPMSIKPDEKPLIRNSPNSELEGFQICGEDHKWVWADAKIDGDSVVVSSAAVPAPVAVRYAWADNPTCNLYNKAGLPACPFHTDTFPGITEKSSL